eukprot:63833_1
MTNTRNVKMESNVKGSAMNTHVAKSGEEVQMMWRLLCQRLFSVHLKHELAVELKSCPDYIRNILNLHCNSIQRIGIYSLDERYSPPEFEAMQYKVLDMFYKTDNEWIDLELICSIFPNVQKISYDAVFQDVLFLSNGSFFEAIYNFITNNKSSIQRFVITVRSVYEEEIIYKMGQYQHQFNVQNWEIKVMHTSDVLKQFDTSMFTKMLNIESQRLSEILCPDIVIYFQKVFKPITIYPPLFVHEKN